MSGTGGIGETGHVVRGINGNAQIEIAGDGPQTLAIAFPVVPVKGFGHITRSEDAAVQVRIPGSIRTRLRCPPGGYAAGMGDEHDA